MLPVIKLLNYTSITSHIKHLTSKNQKIPGQYNNYFTSHMTKINFLKKI